MIFSHISKLLSVGDYNEFQIPVSEQMDYLKRLSTPRNDLERSLFQFKCQGYFTKSSLKRCIVNVTAAIFNPFIVIILFLKGLFVKKRHHIDFVMEDNGMPEIIPNSLREDYALIPVKLYRMMISIGDVAFLFRVAAVFVLYPYYFLKALLNIAQYSYIIRSYSPSLIVRAEEDSASSSLLTAYCEVANIKHYNVMHGEKFCCIKDAFFRFHKCYVWDRHYVNLFTEEGADPEQFVVELPRSMIIDVSKYYNQSVYAKYKYYLQEFTEEELKGIVASLPFGLKDKTKIRFRPHPRYSNMSILRKYVPEELIEKPTEVSILESISNMIYAIGSFTTVLTQAYFSNKGVILDDVTYKEQYDKLKEMRFFLIDKEIPVLSKWKDN